MEDSAVPFLAFVTQDADLATLKQFSQLQGFDTSLIKRGTIDDATEYLKQNPSPALLMVELPSEQQASAQLDALAEVVDADTKVITIGDVNQYSFYCWLTDIGIFAYLLKPLTMDVVQSIYQKSKQTVIAATEEKPTAKIIAVMGTRGGVGATTLAVNLAGLLAHKTKKQVALVDLDPQEGSVALALDIEPSHGLREVLEKPDRIDALFLERVMTKLENNLSVLSAEEALADRLQISEAAATPLLAELKEKYDYVVLDVPRHMNLFTRTCLLQADFSVLVTELSLLCLRDVLRMQDAMKDVWSKKPPLIVANNVGLSAKHEVPIEDFERGTHSKLAQKIPFAPDIFMAMEQSIAAVKHINHAAVAPLLALLPTFAPEIKPTKQIAAKQGFSFFKKKEG